MTLKQYYKASGKSQTAVAKDLGMKPQQLCDIANGRVPVSLQMCNRILQATEGMVTLKDLRPDLYESILLQAEACKNF